MTSKSEWLRRGDDGKQRCWWPGDDGAYIDYHDREWGRAQLDDRLLFEKICLEGFQSGLSWLTILRKRDNFRTAFAQFDPLAVSRFSDDDVARLMADAGIVRHRGKITAVINNARRASDLVAESGSLRGYLWSFAIADATRGESAHGSGTPATSPASEALSRDLKRRGWRFVGPTTMYSLMQATGMVNDHLDGCCVREECESERAVALAQLSREE